MSLKQGGIMNKQYAIDTIKREFRGKAVDLQDTTQCLYLTDDGKKCAIGCFIPENHPASSPNLRLGIGDVLYDMPELWKYMPSDDIDDLIWLQHIHDALDESDSVESQKEELINFIKERF